MGKDLGTYHCRVELEDGRGWVEKWSTGATYIGGASRCAPLGAQRIGPYWRDESQLLQAMVYQYVDGNMSCDCNKELALAQAAHRPYRADASACGDKLTLRRLTLIRPDGTEQVIWGAT